MYQLGYTSAVWDPLFGAGSRRVLDSRLSHSLPISDAALGTLAYTLEFLMGYMGGPARWRTMPWMVTFFGILVIPLGLVHAFLVVSQPVFVGEWCTLCLIAAAIMLPMIPLEVDEVVAMAQHVKQARQRGESGWRVFWKGGDPDGATADRRTPPLVELPRTPARVLAASVYGMSAPWSLVAAAVLGAVAMAMPGLLSVAGPIATVLHLGGALILVAAVLAMGEVLRLLRFLNVPVGLTIAVLPWTAGDVDVLTCLVTSALGLAAAGTSLPRGRVRERYGAWDRLVR
jgi:hypothetical protein